MSAETMLRATLAAHAPLVALVGSRIAADRAEEGWPRPFVVFSRTGNENHADINNRTLGAQVFIELQVWADSRASAEAVAQACQDAIEDAGEAVASRSSGYDSELDVEASMLMVEWWQD